MTNDNPVTLGVIVGNRGFFPDHLCATGRRQIVALLEKEGIHIVITPEEATNNGAVETLAEARLCADLFRARRDDIDGVLVTLPNFGDERAVANVLRWADLGVPVLMHAFADSKSDMSLTSRRDSFCGKISACNNLRQYGIPFSLTSRHTMDPASEAFAEDLRRFAATCRVVRSLKNLRLGQIGARPAAFNTVRYSEKLLEQAGISVETLDLSELLGWIRRLDDDEGPVTDKIEAMRAYTRIDGIPRESLLKMAKLGVCIDRFMEDQGLAATAIQCWTSLEEFYGVVPCTAMSMMSDRLMASACEADIVGALSMYVLQEAARVPAALLDWNNDYGGRSEQGGRIPLLEPAQILLCGRGVGRAPHGFSGNHRRSGRQGEYVRHHCGADRSRGVHVRPHYHGRSGRPHARLCGRGRFHAGHTPNLRGIRGVRGGEHAGIAPVYVRIRI